MSLRRWLWLAPLLLVVVAASAWFVNRRLRQAPPPADPIHMAWAAKARSSVTFVLGRSGVLDFSVPAGSKSLRLLINANLPGTVLQEGLSRELPRKPRLFKLELEERGPWGRVLRRRPWHFLAQATAYRDPKDGNLRPAMFYLAHKDIPSSAYEIILDFSQVKTRVLRLRLLEADPDIRDFVVRAYSPTLGSDSHLSQEWERLADPVRGQLLAGNVYPEGLLRDQEKQNILSRLWQPLAPNSSWGPRPEMRELYQVQEPMEPEAGARYEPYGLKLDSTREGVVHIPMSGGRIRLQAQGWGPEPAVDPARRYLGVYWVGPGLGNRRFQRVPWPHHSLEWEAPLGGGFLILDANRLGFVRAWLKKDQGELEITPPQENLGCTLLEPGQQVSFDLAPSLGESIPFRIEVRQVQSSPDPKTARTWLFRDQISARWPRLELRNSPVRFDLLDAQGKVIRSGRLPLDTGLSPLEELPRPFLTQRSSLPATSTFTLPAGARKIRILLEDQPKPPPLPVLVSASNRPPALPRQRVLPNDFFRWDTRETRIPEWFTLRPEGLDDLVREKRWITLRTQYLPDAEEGLLLAGLYEMDPLLPQGDILARELLVPRDPIALPPRQEGVSAYFHELVLGNPQQLLLKDRPGLQLPRPLLLWVGEAPTTLTVDSGDRAPQQHRLNNAVQDLVLPPMPIGSHRILINSEKQGRVFINQQEPRPQDWIRRLAYPLQPGRRLTFLHTRTSRAPEVLTVRFFSTGGGVPPVLRLHLVGPSVPVGVIQHSLTHRERQYQLQFLPGRAALLLLGTGTEQRLSPYASLPIEADLPPGRYQLECELLAGTPGYITVSRSQAGLRPKTLLDQENLLETLP